MAPTDSEIEAMLRAYALQVRSGSEHTTHIVGRVIADRFNDMATRIASLDEEVRRLRDCFEECRENTGRHELARVEHHAKTLEEERRTWIGHAVKVIVSVASVILGYIVNKMLGKAHP